MTDGGDDELLRVSTLGGLLIELRGERLDHLVPAKAAALVAYLADTGRPASRQLLAGLLWSDRPEENARTSLRVTLNRLRRVLADRVVADRNEIRLVGPIDCDSRRLEDAAALDAAELYHGDFLADQEFDGASLFAEWTRSRREHLRSVAVSALLEGIDERRERGDVDRVGELAARLVALEPWNESGQRHLIGALAETRGRAAALAQFKRCQDTLRIELGVEPEHETRQLVEALYGDLTPETSASALAVRRTGLRHEIAPLYGREAETEFLAERITGQDHRLISIVGPGGVGKTRLALATASRAADRFSDGAVFAELAGIQTVADVPALLAEVIDPRGTPDGDPLDHLVSLLGDHHVLMVLDNLEHLLHEGPELWSTLIRCGPGVHVLATSREEVGVAGEDVFHLGGLALPDAETDPAASPAVRLFVERAYRADKSFSLDDHNRAEVAQLCRLVEGMPLHIELAAATTAQIPIGAILDAVAGHDTLIGLPASDRPPRHSTFDAVFEHSWELLDKHLQDVLARLSVAAGGFDLGSGEGIAGASPIDLLRLQRKSLIARDGPDRYRLHELTRQAALRRLGGEPAAVDRARIGHATYHLNQIEEAHDLLNDRNGATIVQRLLTDLDNLRQAWRYAIEAGRADLLGPSAAGLGRLFVRAGRNVEGADLIDLAATAIRDGKLQPRGDHDEARLLVVKSELLMTRSSEAVTGSERALELLAGRPERAAERARAHSVLCVEHVARFDFAAARTHTDAAWTEIGPGDDPGLRALAHVNSAMIEVQRGSPQGALGHLDEAVDLFGRDGDLAGEARALAWLAAARSDRYEIWDALEAARRSHRLYGVLGDDSRLADLLSILARLEASVGEYEIGADHATTAAEMYHRQHDYLEGSALCVYGECLAGLGRRPEARASFERGLGRLRQQGDYVGPSRFALARWARFLIEDESPIEARLVVEEIQEFAGTSEGSAFDIVAEAMLARLDGVDDPATSSDGVRLVLDSPTRLWPIETLVDWHTALRTSNPAVAREAVEAANRLFLDTARSIPDPATRRAYLTRSAPASALRNASGVTDDNHLAHQEGV